MADQLPNSARSTRLIGLDLLRLVAVVLVLGRHMETPPGIFPGPLQSAMDYWKACGGFGVDLFFVLSGFLISGLLFSEYRKHKQLSVPRFYVRRGWKIYPAFFLLIAATFLFNLYVLDYRIRDRIMFSELLFIQCYQQGYWNHTWTLAVEEHFYLALPLVLAFLAWRGKGADNPFRPVLYLVAAVSVICLAARLLTLYLRPEINFMAHLFPTHLRIDSLFFGVAVAYAYHFHSERFHDICTRYRYALLAVGVALVGLTATWTNLEEPYFYTFGLTQLYLGFAAIVVGVLMCRIPVNRITRLLAAIGTYSYSIYLWHMATMYFLIPQMREAGYSWSARFAVYFVSAFVVGIVMAKLVELPTLRLRDRWFPSRSDLPTANTPSLPQTAPATRQAA